MTEPKEPTKATEAELFDVPEGTKDTGRYSVYDRQLGRYVGGVTTEKPSATDARAVGGDHAAVVEV